MIAEKTVSSTQVIVVPPLEVALDNQIAINDSLLAQNYLDFQDYLTGQLRYSHGEPIEWCENQHERRGWLDGEKYSADVETDVYLDKYGPDAETRDYLAKHPVEIISVDW